MTKRKVLNLFTPYDKEYNLENLYITLYRNFKNPSGLSFASDEIRKVDGWTHDEVLDNCSSLIKEIVGMTGCADEDEFFDTYIINDKEDRGLWKAVEDICHHMWEEKKKEGTESLTFEELIHLVVDECTDMYNVLSDTYLWVYNDEGTEIGTASVDEDYAKELANYEKDTGEYWGALLSDCSYVYDDINELSYEGKVDGWVRTDKYLSYLEKRQ